MNLTFKQYRTIDLCIMFIILSVAEALISTAARVWFPSEIYVLSPTFAMVCIVMMRWGAFAAVQAFGGGLALCIASGATDRQFMVYCIGNCFALMALLLFKAFGKDKIREKPSLTLLFTVTAFAGAQIGRWLVGLALGANAGDIVKLFTTDSLSLVFAIVTVQLARKLDGLFEDQKAYLLRTQAERNKSQIPDYGDTEYGEI